MISEGAENGRFIVVGFDLGHAQTAVATVWADSGEAPAIARLHNRPLDSQVHPTAVARYTDPPDPAPYTIVGSECFSMEEERVASMPDSPDKDVHLAFKSEDIGDARYATELFVTRVVQQLTEPDSETPDGNIAIPPGTPARWVFGVPSGWSRATCEAYEELLRSVVTGLHPGHDVEVVPESRAAMLYAQSQRRTRRGGIHVRLPDLGSVLVIDMGSLTTDYTYVANREETPLDHGSTTLGAALIDQQLMDRTIEGHRHSELLRRAIGDRYARARLEFACRQAKERYFSPPADIGPSGNLAPAKVDIFTSAGEKIRVPVPVPPGMMDEILDTPIDMPGGNFKRSWRETFGSELAAVRTIILEEYGALPQTVLLTGGASRMRFVQDMCRTEFAIIDEEGRSLIYGEEPEYAIARGLAIAGRTQYQVDRFRAEAAVFSSATAPKLVKDNLPPLASALGEVMFSGLVDEQLCPAIGQWRSGEIKLMTDIAPVVLHARKEYIEGPEGSAKLAEVIRSWYNQIARVVNSEAQLVANKYEVPSGEFSISPLDSLDADPDAEIDVRAGLAALRIIANTAATIMTLITAYLTVAIIALAVEAAVAAAIAAGAATATVPGGQVVGPLIAGGAFIAGIWGGKGVMMRGAMKRNVPPRLRKMMGTEEFVLGRVRKRAAADQLEAKAAQNYAESFLTERGDQIVADISAAIKDQLAQAAERAAISIKRRADSRLLTSEQVGGMPAGGVMCSGERDDATSALSYGAARAGGLCGPV
jgi:hypothetical protein